MLMIVIGLMIVVSTAATSCAPQPAYVAEETHTHEQESDDEVDVSIDLKKTVTTAQHRQPTVDRRSHSTSSSSGGGYRRR